MNSTYNSEAPPRTNRTLVCITALICITCLAAFAIWVYKPTGEKPREKLDKSIFITTNTAHLYRQGQFNSVIQPWTLVQVMGDLPGGWVRVRVNSQEYDLGESNIMQAESYRTKLIKEIAKLQDQKSKMTAEVESLLSTETSIGTPNEQRKASQMQLSIENAEKQIAKKQEVLEVIDNGIEFFSD